MESPSLKVPAPAKVDRVDLTHLQSFAIDQVCKYHPGVDSRANLKSISHRFHLLEVAFAGEVTQETIHLPRCCLQGREPFYLPYSLVLRVE